MGDIGKLRLYNTLTREREPKVFVPLDPANVRMYVCGPTVYDFAHIGNARPVIVFDVLFRLLRHLYGAEHVTYVRNITDVDDKINARALRDHPELPLNEAIRRVTEKTAQQFFADVKALGTLEPTHQPRATENIDGMQRLIADLITRGHAYVADGEVLFDVASMPDYGQLSGRNLEANVAGARIAVEAHKKNPADFVLWKLSSPEEPGWDSPWGRGRPGWHIECSAMSERYLWDEIYHRLSPEAQAHPYTFDIHGGGLDLIFPHHENEIAQSRCAHGTHAMANYWLHNGFLQVEGQKMSKSLGNFVTINELLETEKFGGRKWDALVLRLAMLMTHYREPIDFSVKRLEEAESRLRKWRSRSGLFAIDQMTPPDEEVVSALSDDLDFGRAMRRLDVIASAKASDEIAVVMASTLHFLGLQQSADNALDAAITMAPGFDELFESFAGARISHSQMREDLLRAISLKVVDLKAARLAALEARDFAKADQIRADLLAQGIQFMDSKDESGKRITKWEIKR